MVTQPPVVPAPTFGETIETLTAYGDAPESLDLLAAVEWVTKSHTGSAHELPNGGYGLCDLCHKPWPCPAWDEIRGLTLAWIIKTSTNAVRASRQNLRRPT